MGDAEAFLTVSGRANSTPIVAGSAVLKHKNAEHWRNAAAANTRAEREQRVNQGAASPGGAKPESSTATHLRAFKFHDDQIEDVDSAIDKAKKASGAECDSGALDSIRMDFLGAHTLADRLKKVGVETASKALDEVAALGPSAATAFVEQTSCEISDRGRPAIRQRRPR